MKNTFLIEALSWLSTEDMTELGLFVESRFHNRGSLRDDIIRLFEYLLKLHPEFRLEDIEKEKVYQMVFPGHPKVSGKLEKLASGLYKLVREFLLLREYQRAENGFDQSMDWARILRNNHEDEKFEAALIKIEKQFLLDSSASPESFFQKFQVEELRQEYYRLTNKGKEDVNLNNTIYSLSVFFEVYRFEYLNQLLLQQKLTQVPISDKIISILNFDYNLVPYSDNIILDISQKIHKLFSIQVPEEEDFQILMDSLKDNESLIAPEILSNYYTYLRNASMLMLHAGHENFLRIHYALLRDNLERGYLYHANQLHPNTLMNLVRVAAATDNIQWALECLESEKTKIFDDNETHDYYRLNLALCKFDLKEYDAALELIPASSANVSYHLMARRLELMCYYEINSPLLIYKLDAFKIFIWRASEKHLSESLKEANKAFINIFLQLASIPPGDKEKLARLKKRIQEKGSIAESRWLLAKVG
jgi:hypothetical protein